VQIAAIALAALAAGGVAYVLVMPLMSGERKVSKRVANAAQGQARARARSGLQSQPLQMRKKQVQDTIKEIEAREKQKRKVTLRTRLLRAGLDITPRTYYLLSALAGLLGGFIVLITGSSLLVSLLVAFVCAIGVPRWLLARLIKKRQAKFLIEFANAIDIIVRGIKSGLPLPDCLQIAMDRVGVSGQRAIGIHLGLAEAQRRSVGLAHG
jgi:tight adherence protein B